MGPEAVNTAGRAVMFAGTTVVIALGGLFVLGIDFMNGLAVGCGHHRDHGDAHGRHPAARDHLLLGTCFRREDAPGLQARLRSPEPRLRAVCGPCRSGALDLRRRRPCRDAGAGSSGPVDAAGLPDAGGNQEGNTPNRLRPDH